MINSFDFNCFVIGLFLSAPMINKCIFSSLISVIACINSRIPLCFFGVPENRTTVLPLRSSSSLILFPEKLSGLNKSVFGPVGIHVPPNIFCNVFELVMIASAFLVCFSKAFFRKYDSGIYRSANVNFARLIGFIVRKLSSIYWLSQSSMSRINFCLAFFIFFINAGRKLGNVILKEWIISALRSL